MAATAAQVAQLRRMVSEPTTTTYSDVQIAAYIELYPLVDARGESPWVEPFGASDTETTEPLAANDDWTPTYDLNAAAADIWAEKAGTLAARFDFSTDGQSFSRNQAYQAAMSQSRYFRARRSQRRVRVLPSPRPDADELTAEA